ncbi:class I SAM-dependent methyltransferase [Chloroflexota bacterium]
MSLGNKLLRLYFDLVYNPIYDLTTARLTAYRRWHSNCVGKLGFEDGDSILCVGVGTGNEIPYILNTNRDLEIVGVDFSERALRKAYQKGLRYNRKIKISRMDSQELRYPAESFDKVLCLHVMDFVEDDKQATREIIRVLKEGGQFVITYPSNKEGMALGLSLIRDNIRHSSSPGKYLKTLQELLMLMTLGILYIPVLLRAKKRAYSYAGLEAVFAQMKQTAFQIEEYPVYSDYIVYGKKEIQFNREESNASRG